MVCDPEHPFRSYRIEGDHLSLPPKTDDSDSVSAYFNTPKIHLDGSRLRDVAAIKGFRHTNSATLVA